MANTTRTGGERRGNNQDRRRRKLWLLATYGDGETCNCVHCGCPVTYDTVQADRIVPGGSYCHDNIQPACGPCNRARSNNPDWVPFSKLMEEFA